MEQTLDYNTLCSTLSESTNPLLVTHVCESGVLDHYKAYGCYLEGYPLVLMFTPNEYTNAVLKTEHEFFPASMEATNVVEKGKDGAYYVILKCSDGSHVHRLRMPPTVFTKRVSYRVHNLEVWFQYAPTAIRVYKDFVCLNETMGVYCCEEIHPPGSRSKYKFFTRNPCQEHAWLGACDKFELEFPTIPKTYARYRSLCWWYKQVGSDMGVPDEGMLKLLRIFSVVTTIIFYFIVEKHQTLNPNKLG